MLKIMVGIYKITSPSNKVYIGQSWNIEKRLNNYKNGRSNGQPKLHNSILKYGFDSHEIKIIHELPFDIEQEVLDRYEQTYIDSYRDCGIELLNIREAGSRGRHTDESKRKMRESGEKLKEWRMEILVGNKIWLGRSHKEETKQKQSAASIGKPKSEDHAKKCAETGRQQAIKNKKPVIQLSKLGEFIKEWPSLKDAGDSLNIMNQSITHACKGKYKSAGGFKWKYKI